MNLLTNGNLFHLQVQKQSYNFLKCLELSNFAFVFAIKSCS